MVGATKGEPSTQLCAREPRLPDPRSQREAAPDGSLSCGSAGRQPANPRVTRRRCCPPVRCSDSPSPNATNRSNEDEREDAEVVHGGLEEGARKTPPDRGDTTPRGDCAGDEGHRPAARRQTDRVRLARRAASRARPSPTKGEYVLRGPIRAFTVGRNPQRRIPRLGREQSARRGAQHDLSRQTCAHGRGQSGRTAGTPCGAAGRRTPPPCLHA
jgi:hypothetical protein